MTRERFGRDSATRISSKVPTTIELDPETDRLLTQAAQERGISRSELILEGLARALEPYRRHPQPRSAGVVSTLTERGNESELFGAPIALQR